jgi:hypothetical protein
MFRETATAFVVFIVWENGRDQVEKDPASIDDNTVARQSLLTPLLGHRSGSDSVSRIQQLDNSRKILQESPHH